MVMLLLALGRAFSQDEEAAPFTVHTAPVTLRDGKGRLTVTVDVPSGHHVFRDTLEVRVSGPTATFGQPSLPAGTLEPDPSGAAPYREVYAADVVVDVAVAGAPGPVHLEVRVQGCRGDVCWMPTTTALVTELRAGGPGGSRPADAPLPRATRPR